MYVPVKIRRLLASSNKADRMIAIELFQRDPNTDFQFKYWLYTKVGAGLVEAVWNTSYERPPNWLTMGPIKRCRLWKLERKII